jgi:hypothetical protein
MDSFTPIFIFERYEDQVKPKTDGLAFAHIGAHPHSGMKFAYYTVKRENWPYVQVHRHIDFSCGPSRDAPPIRGRKTTSTR